MLIDVEACRGGSDAATPGRDAQAFLHSVLQTQGRRDAVLDLAAATCRGRALDAVWPAMLKKIKRFGVLIALARLALQLALQPNARELRAALDLHAALAGK